MRLGACCFVWCFEAHKRGFANALYDLCAVKAAPAYARRLTRSAIGIVARSDPPLLGARFGTHDGTMHAAGGRGCWGCAAGIMLPSSLI
jgi:hypothetical protein